MGADTEASGRDEWAYRDWSVAAKIWRVRYARNELGISDCLGKNCRSAYHVSWGGNEGLRDVMVWSNCVVGYM